MDSSRFEVSLLAAPLPEQTLGSLPSLLLLFALGTRSQFFPLTLCVFSASACIQVSPCCSLGIKGLQTQGITEETILSNAALYFSTRISAISAEEGRGLAQLINRRMVLLDNFSCSGLMASSPGKPRRCTGPILFTRIGGVSLKPLQKWSKNSKFKQFRSQISPFG